MIARYRAISAGARSQRIARVHGEIKRATRIVLLIANGVWLPLFAFGGASRLYLLTTKGLEWPFLLFGVATTVVCSFILAGNVPYIWRSRPHAHK